VVVIPKGVWHCPMEALKVEKPFLCMAVSLTTHYDVKYWSEAK
jgi:ureidoglycolate hydrolase